MRPGGRRLFGLDPLDPRSCSTSSPVSTGMGDCLGIFPATQLNSAWPSLGG